jgi:hypothetical protein
MSSNSNWKWKVAVAVFGLICAAILTADIYNAYLPQVPYLADTGSASAIVLNGVVGIHPTATAGDCVRTKAAASATGATTIAITPAGGSEWTGGTITVDKKGPTGLIAIAASGDYVIGQSYTLCYDGTVFYIDSTSGLPYVGGTNAAGNVMLGNSNSLQSSTKLVASNSTGFFTTIGNQALVGQSVPLILATINSTGNTGAIATATLCTAALCGNASAGQYHLHWNFWGSGTACSSVTAGSVTFLLTWTDENAVTHSAVALQMDAQTGAATSAMQSTFPFQTALANESASGDFTFSTNGTIIQYATGYTACTTGTGTYSLRAAVTRVQ